jgi:putative ABC transport system permease protein
MKDLLDSTRIAIDALKINKLRSGLTMLGIVIGVAAVIAMVSIGSGASERIREQIASIGSNVIVVMPGSITTSGVRLGAGFAMTLTIDDARAITDECPAVAAAAPTVRGGGQVVYGNRNWATSIQGTTPEYFEIRDQSLISGDIFNEQDVSAATKVAVLGKTVADNFFGGEDPAGKIIRIRNVPFTVLGVLEPKGQSPTGQDQDDLIITPITTAKKRLLGGPQAAANAVGSILATARDSGSIEEAQTQIETLLRQRHRIAPGDDDDFNVRNLEEVFTAQEASARVMSILLASIASVSLIVGGIGIMNIMLVSVTERTKEIGLRMAVGAKTKNILAQFLVEAVTLAIMGGAAGIALGVTSSMLISYFAGWSTHTGVEAILLAFLFSALVGVFFGYYPARKAALLNPIEALRYE